MLREKSVLQPEETRLIESDVMQSILSDVSDCPLSDILFFDIETTGFSPEASFVFLIGCICQEDGTWILHQFFIRLVQEESVLLSSFFELAEKATALVHFNGNRFDLPFLKKRTEINHLQPLSDTLLSVDLFRRFRSLKKALDLPHMNQSFLEKYVGWERDDQMSGKEVIAQFWSYESARNENAMHLILRHNHDDLLGMLQVSKLEAYRKLMDGCIMPDVIAVESADHSHLQIAFTARFPLPRPLSVQKEDSAQSGGILALEVRDCDGVLCIPIFEGTLRYFFPDYKNYYYLPLEEQAIHKSIASYVSKEYRIPARPETCYSQESGYFLPLPSTRKHSADGQAEDFLTILSQEPFSPALQKSYSSRERYFAYKPEFLEQSASLSAYAQMMIRQIFEQK